MSKALGMASLGTQCQNKSLGMSSLGTQCGILQQIWKDAVRFSVLIKRKLFNIVEF